MTCTRSTAIWFIAVSLIFCCCASAQENNLDPQYTRSVNCLVSRSFTTETFGPDFSIKLVLHEHPISGVSVLLIRGGMMRNSPDDGAILASAPTNSEGIARFFAVPPGKYTVSVEGGLLFSEPEMRVESNGEIGRAFSIEWPDNALKVRTLRGKLLGTEKIPGPTVPLQETSVQLLDLRTGQLLQDTFTSVDGSYAFSSTAPGLYGVRVTPPPKPDVRQSSAIVAIELDPAAKERSIPELRLRQAECIGIAIFRQTKPGIWERE
jgi:hypothetical protein